MQYKNIEYDAYCPKVARPRRKFIALDSGDSGVFLLEKATRRVFTIKGYGVPNRYVGTLEELTAQYEASIKPNRKGAELAQAHQLAKVAPLSLALN